MCRANEVLRARWYSAAEEEVAATEGRRGDIRLGLLHIGCGIEEMLEYAGRIQRAGS